MDRYNFYLLQIFGYTFLYFFFLNIAFIQNDLVHGGLNLIVSVRFHLNSWRTRSNSSIAYFLQRYVVWRRNVRHEPTAWPLINVLIYFLNVLFFKKFLYSFCRLISVNFADYSAEQIDPLIIRKHVRCQYFFYFIIFLNRTVFLSIFKMRRTNLSLSKFYFGRTQSEYDLRMKFYRTNVFFFQCSYCFLLLSLHIRIVNFICSDLCDFAIHIIYPISSVHPIRMKISCHFNHHSHVIAFNVLYTYTRTISIIFSTITEYSSVFWHHGEINYSFGQHFTSLHSVVSPTSPPSTFDTEKREKEILLKRQTG